MRKFFNNAGIGKLLRLVREIIGKKIPQHAAYACFFTVLAVFPTLVLLLGLLRYTGLDVHTLTEAMKGIVPTVLLGWVERLVISAYRATSGTVISLSALVALWSASRGVHGIMTGLNAIYEVSEDRGYLRTRLLSALYTFLFLLVLLLTLALHVFGATILEHLTAASDPVFQFLTTVVDLRFILLLILQTALFSAMFMALPNRKNKLKDSLPGAVFASIGWLVFSDLYSIYVEHFSAYANVFGSVYAVALSMVWLYCCMSIVFYGGALNRYLVENE